MTSALMLIPNAEELLRGAKGRGVGAGCAADILVRADDVGGGLECAAAPFDYEVVGGFARDQETVGNKLAGG